MKLLKNFDSYVDYYDLNKKIYCSFDYLKESIGLYKKIDEIFTAVFVENNSIYFLYGEKRYLITDESRAEIEVYDDDFQKQFTLFCKDDLLVDFRYELPDESLNISPFEYIDEEDFDWGVFLEKIINDKKRKGSFLAAQANGSDRLA